MMVVETLPTEIAYSRFLFPTKQKFLHGQFVLSVVGIGQKMTTKTPHHPVLNPQKQKKCTEPAMQVTQFTV